MLLTTLTLFNCYCQLKGHYGACRRDVELWLPVGDNSLLLCSILIHWWWMEIVVEVSLAMAWRRLALFANSLTHPLLASIPPPPPPPLINHWLMKKRDSSREERERDITAMAALWVLSSSVEAYRSRRHTGIPCLCEWFFVRQTVFKWSSTAAVVVVVISWSQSRNQSLSEHQASSIVFKLLSCEEVVIASTIS